MMKGKLQKLFVSQQTKEPSFSDLISKMSDNKQVNLFVSGLFDHQSGITSQKMLNKLREKGYKANLGLHCKHWERFFETHHIVYVEQYSSEGQCACFKVTHKERGDEQMITIDYDLGYNVAYKKAQAISSPPVLEPAAFELSIAGVPKGGAGHDKDCMLRITPVLPEKKLQPHDKQALTRDDIVIMKKMLEAFKQLAGNQLIPENSHFSNWEIDATIAQLPAQSIIRPAQHDAEALRLLGRTFYEYLTGKISHNAQSDTATDQHGISDMRKGGKECWALIQELVRGHNSMSFERATDILRELELRQNEKYNACFEAIDKIYLNPISSRLRTLLCEKVSDADRHAERVLGVCKMVIEFQGYKPITALGITVKPMPLVIDSDISLMDLEQRVQEHNQTFERNKQRLEAAAKNYDEAYEDLQKHAIKVEHKGERENKDEQMQNFLSTHASTMQNNIRQAKDVDLKIQQVENTVNEMQKAISGLGKPQYKDIEHLLDPGPTGYLVYASKQELKSYEFWRAKNAQNKVHALRSEMLNLSIPERSNLEKTLKTPAGETLKTCLAHPSFDRFKEYYETNVTLQRGTRHF